MEEIRFFTISDLQNQREQAQKRYLEFLRVPAMSAGVYVLAAGSTDLQSPHNEDETPKPESRAVTKAQEATAAFVGTQ